MFNTMFDAVDRIKISSLQGNKLLHLDYSNCTYDQVSLIIAEARKIIDKQSAKSLLSLSDFTNTQLSTEMVMLIGKFAKANEPFIKAGATVGLTTVQHSILDAVNKISKRNIRYFKDQVKAKNWLINHDNPAFRDKNI